MFLDGGRAEGSERAAEEREGRLESVDSGTESADDRYASPHTFKLHPTAQLISSLQSLKRLVLYVLPLRENDSCDSRGDSTAGDRPERGAFSLPESPERTPSPRGEIRRPQGGDGSFFGEQHICSCTASNEPHFYTFV